MNVSKLAIALGLLLSFSVVADFEDVIIKPTVCKWDLQDYYTCNDGFELVEGECKLALDDNLSSDSIFADEDGLIDAN